jgi:hypothetical protein
LSHQIKLLGEYRTVFLARHIAGKEAGLSRLANEIAANLQPLLKEYKASGDSKLSDAIELSLGIIWRHPQSGAVAIYEQIFADSDPAFERLKFICRPLLSHARKRAANSGFDGVLSEGATVGVQQIPRKAERKTDSEQQPGAKPIPNLWSRYGNF